MKQAVISWIKTLDTDFSPRGYSFRYKGGKNTEVLLVTMKGYVVHVLLSMYLIEVKDYVSVSVETPLYTLSFLINFPTNFKASTLRVINIFIKILADGTSS
jgi:hypothetical protein